MKKQLGQFFTTNSDYILQGFEKFVVGKNITDPFAGNQDLLVWAEGKGCKKVTGFDYDKKYVDNKKVFYNDSLNSLKKYQFVCANPPYLHKNKADQETKKKFFLGEHSHFEDLYQISILSMLDSQEGILIVPLNFLCAENSRRIRALFFNKFKIVKLNIFTEQVFDDTTYNVVAFYFNKKNQFENKNKVSAVIFPQKKKISFTIEKKFNWQLGGNFVNTIKSASNSLGIFRLTESFLQPGDQKVEIAIQNIKDRRKFEVSKSIEQTLKDNILFLRAIDSKNGKKIQIEDIRKYDIAGLAGKSSSRNMAHLIFKQKIPIHKQEELMEQFNEILNQNRKKYFSFFLTNFRDNNRKRISFDFVYKFLNYLHYEQYAEQPTLF